jgi:hypothetical protein
MEGCEKGKKREPEWNFLKSVKAEKLKRQRKALLGKQEDRREGKSSN